MSLVVKAKVKEVIKDCNTASDFVDAVSGMLEKILADAVVRAKDNGRRTVMGRDVAFAFCPDLGTPKENIIVKSKIKELVGDCNVAGDLADMLNKVGIKLILFAEKRALDNSRKTVMAKDL